VSESLVVCDASEAVIVSPLTIDYTPLLLLLLLLPLHSPVLHLSVCLSLTSRTCLAQKLAMTLTSL